RVRPGDFIIQGAPLIELKVKDGNAVPDDAREKLSTAAVLGDKRTFIQDIEFALQELVEIAVRALSPGINDPFTACTCVDRLAAGLAKMATRGDPPHFLNDAQGLPRVKLR